MKNNWTVYRHKSPSGKVYVGITSMQPELRWSKGYGKQTIFGKAIKKYGWNNFSHDILFTHLTKEKAEEKEIEFIKIYKDARISYNDAEGGFCRGKQSEQTKQLIRQKALGHKRNLGHVTSETTKKKIGEANRGRRVKEEVKEKLRNHPNIKGNTNRRKTLYQLNDRGELIAIYNSTYEAQLKTNISRCNISACCKGRLQHAGGFKWTYNYETDTDQKI